MMITKRTGSLMAIAAITSACNLSTSTGGSNSPLPTSPTDSLVGQWVSVESVTMKDGKEMRTSISESYTPEIFNTLTFESSDHGIWKLALVQESRTCETSVQFKATYPSAGVLEVKGSGSQQTGDLELGCPPAEKAELAQTFQFKVSGSNLELKMDIPDASISTLYKRVAAPGDGVPFALANVSGLDMNGYATKTATEWATDVIPGNRLSPLQRKCIRRQENKIRNALRTRDSRLAELIRKKSISKIDIALVDLSSEPESIPHETHKGISTAEFKGKLAVHPSLKGPDCEIVSDEDLETLAAAELLKL